MNGRFTEIGRLHNREKKLKLKIHLPSPFPLATRNIVPQAYCAPVAILSTPARNNLRTTSCHVAHVVNLGPLCGPTYLLKTAFLVRIPTAMASHVHSRIPTSTCIKRMPDAKKMGSMFIFALSGGEYLRILPPKGAQTSGPVNYFFISLLTNKHVQKRPCH